MKEVVLYMTTGSNNVLGFCSIFKKKLTNFVNNFEFGRKFHIRSQNLVVL